MQHARHRRRRRRAARRRSTPTSPRRKSCSPRCTRRRSARTPRSLRPDRRRATRPRGAARDRDRGIPRPVPQLRSSLHAVVDDATRRERRRRRRFPRTSSSSCAARRLENNRLLMDGIRAAARRSGRHIVDEQLVPSFLWCVAERTRRPLHQRAAITRPVPGGTPRSSSRPDAWRSRSPSRTPPRSLIGASAPSRQGLSCSQPTQPVPGSRGDRAMADLMPMVHAERQSLSDFLDTLTPEQWTAAHLVHKWNVQDLVGAPHRGGQHHRAALLRRVHQDRLQLRQVRRRRPAAVTTAAARPT